MSKSNENRLDDLQNLEPSLEEFRASVVDGLSSPQKTLPCKFLYDERGSQIFDDICDLPEYYPTRTERRILERHARDIAAGIDAMTDGLWLGMYLSGDPVDLKQPMRLAAMYLAAAFPAHAEQFRKGFGVTPKG